MSAKVNLALHKEIPAPVTGALRRLRLVDQGNIVQAADTNGLVVITQMDPISVIFTISEDQLPPVVQKIAAAGEALEVDTYDREGLKTKLAQGSLTTLDRPDRSHHRRTLSAGS